MQNEIIELIEQAKKDKLEDLQIMNFVLESLNDKYNLKPNDDGMIRAIVTDELDGLIKCAVCGLECLKDLSELCLHCWCVSNNLVCECGCIQAQDESFLEKISLEASQ